MPDSLVCSTAIACCLLLGRRAVAALRGGKEQSNEMERLGCGADCAATAMLHMTGFARGGCPGIMLWKVGGWASRPTACRPVQPRRLNLKWAARRILRVRDRLVNTRSRDRAEDKPPVAT